MTYIETWGLVPGDRVTYKQLEGIVIHARKETIIIDWQTGGDSSIYMRTNMKSIQRPTWTEADRIARLVRLEKVP